MPRVHDVNFMVSGHHHHQAGAGHCWSLGLFMLFILGSGLSTRLSCCLGHVVPLKTGGRSTCLLRSSIATCYCVRREHITIVTDVMTSSDFYY